MKLGTARTILTYNNLLHIVKLDNYEQTIDRITDSLNTFQHFDELQDTFNITKIKLLDLKNKFNSIKPSIRNKRGLINGLGTIIKSITGNMDARDAHHINEEIKNLMTNQSNIKSEVKKQILINNRMVERFETITNHINSQQNAIESYLNRFKKQIDNKITTDREITKHAQYLNQINFNIDILHNHLTNLAEAIVLARLNVISKQILNPEEITEIYYNLENQTVEIKSNEHIYELLGLQAYYSNSNIIFNVRIPVLSHEKYSMLHMIPLPLNETRIISTKPYIIQNHIKIQYFDEICPKIEDVYYCKESPYQESTSDSTCIAPLLQNKPAECQVAEGIHTSDIIQPENNYILLINVPETIVKSSCETKQLQVKGTQLIHFTNCTVEINNVKYLDHISSHWDNIYIHPVTSNFINYSSTIEDLKLKRLKSYHIANKKEIELLQLETEQKDYFIFGIITIISFIVMLILLHLIYKKVSTSRTSPAISEQGTIPENLHNIPTNSIPGIQLLWPSLHT